MFLNNWGFVEGSPYTLLSDNGPQFAASLFESLSSSLCIRHLFTSIYHPQSNGQVERFNRTLLAGLRIFVMDNLKTWPEHVGALTYSYNTTVHPSLDLTTFQLDLTEPPKGSILIRNEPEYDKKGKLPKDFHRRIIIQCREMYEKASPRLKEAQEKYKRIYDKTIKPLRHAQPGDWVCVERVLPVKVASYKKRREHKLLPKAQGPFEVVESDSNSVTILRNDRCLERISRNRTVQAPPGAINEPVSPMQKIIADESDTGVDETLIRARDAIRAPRVSASNDESEYHVVAKILNYDGRTNMFEVKWLGYDESTEEPPGHLR